jgi:DegV family protein with EDD domain
MKIITDTGSLISVKEAQDLDIELIPLQVEVKGINYKDYLDISCEEFVELTKSERARTSLPSIGQVMEIYEQYKTGIHICVAKGLSSTYDVAASALRELSSDLILYNSKALVGTQRYLVMLAKRLSLNHSPQEIIERMDKCLTECQSFLIPVDFNFLKRSGRISPMAATFAGMMGIKPILTFTPGMEKLDKFGVGRTWPQAFNQIIKKMTQNAVSLKHKIYIVHAMNLETAKLLEERLRQSFGNLDIEYLNFSPVLMALGGPGCVAVQYILKDDEA